ncbi:uncharacterized protein EV422DRAFT_539333 [Fimicolochytrium jonesii]|uniref:uncharacterized protein n=1 Tax=Fimicolochytrium jonesii TaxID=1396493 RepID=UPI0022FF0090|nr:uncharacterized protein EV422DRAFT_539333 [Fimicolochytrium jonesii]KAI8817916.1 hypothetical protein EV422DRAFT_539333 [Fimicolochytrium jonesii]
MFKKETSHKALRSGLRPTPDHKTRRKGKILDMKQKGPFESVSICFDSSVLSSSGSHLHLLLAHITSMLVMGVKALEHVAFDFLAALLSGCELVNNVGGGAREHWRWWATPPPLDNLQMRGKPFLAIAFSSITKLLSGLQLLVDRLSDFLGFLSGSLFVRCRNFLCVVDHLSSLQGLLTQVLILPLLCFVELHLQLLGTGTAFIARTLPPSSKMRGSDGNRGRELLEGYDRDGSGGVTVFHGRRGESDAEGDGGGLFRGSHSGEEVGRQRQLLFLYESVNGLARK